jgi:hypothetical protein
VTVGVVVAGALVAVLFATVSTSGGVGMWVEPQWDPVPREPGGTSRDPATVPDETQPPELEPGQGIELPGWLEAVLNAAVVAIGVAAGTVLLVAAWRHRPRLRWRRRTDGDPDFEVLPDVAAAVLEEAAAQRAELLTGSVRNAIVRCWLRLERDVAAAGLSRDPADTSAEFTERVLARFAVDPTTIGELAALYREARFSQHPLDEAARRDALTALDRLHRSLGAPAVANQHATGTAS